MASRAKLLRQAIKARLDADVNVTATVEQGTRYLTGEEELPRIFVRMPEEEVIELVSFNPRREKTVGRVAIVYAARATEGEALENELEDGADAIRLAMAQDEFLGGASDATHYSGFEKSQNKDGASPIGSIAVRFECHYIVDAFEGVVIADDLDEITGGIDIDEDDVSEADIDIQFGGP